MAKIIGMGRYFPPTIRKNDEWSSDFIASFQDHLKRDLLDIADHGVVDGIDQFSLDNIRKEKIDPFLGAVERHVIENNANAYDLSVEAGKIAIKEANVDPRDIDAVFSYDFAPDRLAAASSTVVSHKLGIANAFACQLEAACASQMVQMKVATALVDSGAMRYILLVASNTMTRGLVMGHPASPGIGDAATAILIGPDTCEGHKIINTFSRSYGNYWDAVSWRRRPDESQNWWEAGGPCYLGSYDSNKARELVQITAKTGAATTVSALEEVGMSTSDLNFLVSVQPRKWINAAITKLLNMKDEQSIETYEKFAHLGCCGPIVNLIEAKEKSLIKKDDIVALYAQGAGFTCSTTIIKW